MLTINLNPKPRKVFERFELKRKAQQSEREDEEMNNIVT